MKEWASRNLQTALLWKMATAKVLLFTLSTMGTAIQTACISVDYTTMNAWEHFLLWTGVLTSWSIGMQMFLEKAAKDLASGKPPLGFTSVTDDKGNTQVFKKSGPENG